MGVTELLQLKILLKDIGLNVDGPMKMFYDNKVVINLANNLVFHDRTTHVEIDCHFIRQKIDTKELVLFYVKFQDQVADMFTKGLSYGDHEKNITKLDI